MDCPKLMPLAGGERTNAEFKIQSTRIDFRKLRPDAEILGGTSKHQAKKYGIVVRHSQGQNCRKPATQASFDWRIADDGAALQY
jgi:hypothetical protein